MDFLEMHIGIYGAQRMDPKYVTFSHIHNIKYISGQYVMYELRLN